MIRLTHKYLLSVFVCAFIFLAFTIDIQAQVLNTVWERTDRTGAEEAKPSWFTIGSVRGMAYGTVSGNERVYAADRANSTIRVMEAETGDDLTPSTEFDLSGVSGGTFAMNDVEVSDDGIIFLGNLTTDASSSPFHLYWWTSEGGAYADSLSFSTETSQRLGDKFTVVGSVTDNTAEVWIPASGSDPGVVYVATTSDQGASWDIETITLSGSNVSIPANADASPLEVGREGDFYLVGNGASPRRYNSNGEYIQDSQFPSSEYTGSRNGLNSFSIDGVPHLAVYTYREDGTDVGNKTGRTYVYNVSDTTSPETVAESPLLGDDNDTFSSIHGEAHPKVNDDNTFNIYAFDGVNGFAAYTNAAPTTETVQVTFNVNTSTVPDTLGEDGFVQIRGALNTTLGSEAYGDQNITWDAASTTVGENKGGDYWSVGVTMAPGDSLVYKYWVGLDSETGVEPNGGWEANGPFNNNYLFVLPDNINSDTTLAVTYYNVGNGREAPFTSVDDSVTVYFRVNVGAQVQTENFNPETDKVGVRGNPEFFDNPADWSSSAFFLEPDGQSGDNYFYGGSARIHEDSVASITSEMAYKFVLEKENGSVTWDNVDGNTDGNRFFNVPASDSTLMWAFFQETAPTSSDIVNTNLNFEVNVGILEGLGFFNSSIDTVFVRGGFNDWGTSNQMSFNSFSGNYEASNIPYNAAVGTEVPYKYYVKWDERRDEQSSEFYLSGITHDGSGWEEPGVTGGADRVLTIENSTDQPTQSEFYNGVEPEALMTSGNVEGGSVTVTFSVNMNPAEDYTADPFDPAQDSVYLFVDTPFFALTNNITVPGDNGENFVTQSKEEIERLRFTDEDGDGVYTLELPLTLPTLNHIGFRFAYGSALASDGELLANGGGFDAGRRHYQYVQPGFDNEGNVVWPSTFTFATLDWQREDLPFETPPDYSGSTSNEGGTDTPNQFELTQNYPNPFNPTTTINFTLGTASEVNLTVYNLLGQEVAKLVTDRRMNAGTHSVQFNASSFSSGVYFYRIEAGDFVQQRSMTLIK